MAEAAVFGHVDVVKTLLEFARKQGFSLDIEKALSWAMRDKQDAVIPLLQRYRSNFP